MAIAFCAVTVALVAALLWHRHAEPAGGRSQATGLGFVAVSRPVPAFDLPLLQGRGRVQPVPSHPREPLVLNFWSSTCTICKQESPALDKVARATRGHVSYLGIDTIDRRADAIAFVRRYGISYLNAYDPKGVAAARYGVPGLPVTVFLSESGQRIIGINYGALTARALTSILRKLYGRL